MISTLFGHLSFLWTDVSVSDNSHSPKVKRLLNLFQVIVESLSEIVSESSCGHFGTLHYTDLLSTGADLSSV